MSRRASLLGEGGANGEEVPGNVLFLTPRDGSMGFTVVSCVEVSMSEIFHNNFKAKNKPTNPTAQAFSLTLSQHSEEY